MLITQVWKNQPGDYFCISTKSKSGKWQDTFFAREDLSQVRRFINEHMNKDVYWCPHGFSEPRRLKDYAVLPKLLWADLDAADPRTMTPMPTYAIESSPGRYVGLWSVDTVIEERHNRLLTYHVGADKGGWDLTQVLRVPGTTNYKYPDNPRVKILWADGPSHKLEEIVKLLPKDRIAEIDMGDAMKVYKRYEKRLSIFTRKNLLGGKPKVGKRSEMLWRLNKELIEAGLTTEEAFILLAHSPWNKFAGKVNGDAQLRRELEKSVSQKFQSVSVEPREDGEDTFLTISLAEVEEEQLDWIWYPYLARRELTILEGDPGLGKSYLAQMIGASIVDGKQLPCVRNYLSIKGKVAYFDLENSIGTVTKTRLVDNGCKNLANYFQDDKPFRIDDEDVLEEVYRGLERVKPDLVVFDTINTYIGKTDASKGVEVQQAMRGFIEIARRFNCAVITLRHLTKSSKERAIYRGQGSIAFSGMARVVMTVGTHPDDEDIRVMAVTKLNVTKKPPALTFEITSLPDTLKRQDRSKLIWGEFTDLSSDDIVKPSEEGPKTGRKKILEIRDALMEVLANGPMEKTAVIRAMEARNMNPRTVERAAEDLGVIKEMEGFGSSRRAIWALPDRTKKKGDN